MKKGFWVCMLLVILSVFAAGCKKEEVAVVYEMLDSRMVFTNETEKDVLSLRIRMDEEQEWAEIDLHDGVLESGYEVEVHINAEVPDVNAGWQVAMGYVDGSESIWSDIVMEDGTNYIFSYEEGTPRVEKKEIEKAE